MDYNEEIMELSAEDLEKEKQRVIAKTTANAIADYTGELVYVEGKPWIRVKWAGKSGWILAKYVAIV